jgi:hypothetical protein
MVRGEVSRRSRTTWDTADGRSVMASNTGKGRKGAIRNRFQMHDPGSDRWSVFTHMGKFLRTKKSRDRYKQIKVGPPKRSER